VGGNVYQRKGEVMAGQLFPQNGKWYFKYYDHLGKSHTFSTHTAIKKEAKAIRDDFVGRMARGEFSTNKKIKTTDWIMEHEKHFLANPGVTDGYKIRKSQIYKNLYTFFGLYTKFLNQIDIKIVKEYITERLKSVSGKTVYDDIIVLKEILRDGIAEKYYPATEPILEQIRREQKKIDKSPNVSYPLELDQVWDIIDYMKEHNHPVQWLRVQFLAFSGCRVLEMNLIRPEHIDFDRGVVWLITPPESKKRSGHRTKSGEDRYILLNTPLIEVLETIQSRKIRNNPFRTIKGWRDGYIFPELKKKSNQWLLEAFKKAQEKLGIVPQRNLHNLRHFYTTTTQEIGEFNESEAQLLVGHKNSSMTRRYTHRKAINLRPKMQQFDSIVMKNRESVTTDLIPYHFHRFKNLPVIFSF
jgi:integrase